MSEEMEEEAKVEKKPSVGEMNPHDLEKLAREGDVAAMEEYGSRRLRGVGGVGRDVPDALEWLQKASEKGKANCQSSADPNSKKDKSR